MFLLAIIMTLITLGTRNIFMGAITIGMWYFTIKN